MTEDVLGGRYELCHKVAQGGMGAVWVAWDRKRSSWVAAKVLRHTDADLVLRFVREQSLRVEHPHVVSPQGWSADDDQVVLSMELVYGGSLQTLIGDQGALPSPYAAVILDQLLDGLTALADHRIVHRDLKPANILLDPTGTGWPSARIGDFGIAAVIGEPRFTSTGGSVGTLGYMAPEQARGAEPDPRQDLYALGVLGQTMVTGLPPSQHSPTVPGPLGSWLAHLTADEPDQRPASAAEARRLLRRTGAIPPSASWQDRPDPPEVFDQIGQYLPGAAHQGLVSADSGPGGSTVRHAPELATDGAGSTVVAPPDRRSSGLRTLLRVVMVLSFGLAGIAAFVLIFVLLW